MRKLLLFFFVILSSLTMAEVSLQHTFVGYQHNFVQYDYSSNKSLIYQDNINELYGSAYYYTSFDTTAYMIKQYDADFEMVDSIAFNIPLDSGYCATSCTVTKTIFDDDADSYELIVKYRKQNYDWNVPADRDSLEKVLVYRDDGTFIANLGAAYSIYVYPYLHVYDNEYRIWVQRNYPSYLPGGVMSGEYYDVYFVDKKKNTGLQQVPAHDLPRKVMHDGKVFIIAGDCIVDVLGRDVR